MSFILKAFSHRNVIQTYFLATLRFDRSAASAIVSNLRRDDLIAKYANLTHARNVTNTNNSTTERRNEHARGVQLT